MAGDDTVDEVMEIESLPSTSRDTTKIKEPHVKSANLPWYGKFIFAMENFIFWLSIASLLRV